MRQRMNVYPMFPGNMRYLPPGLVGQVADLAACKKLSRSAIMEAAVTSFLSPDGADRREAAFTRRLDRLTRQVERLERNTGVTMEMLALVARFFFKSMRSSSLRCRWCQTPIRPNRRSFPPLGHL
jgi:hypothetical protein